MKRFYSVYSISFLIGLLYLSEKCYVSIYHFFKNGHLDEVFFVLLATLLQHCQLLNFSLPPQIVIVFNVYVLSLNTNWGHGQNSDWEWVLELETIYIMAEQLG